MPVYVIRAGDTGAVKIGFTAGPARTRLAKMQTDNHERLTVLRWLDGGEEEERALHVRYIDLRIRGDWFQFCDTMLGDVGIPDIAVPKKASPPIWSAQEGLDAVRQNGVHGLIQAAGVAGLMRRLGVARTTILDWKRTGMIPANRVRQISKELELPVADVVKLAPQPRQAA